MTRRQPPVIENPLERDWPGQLVLGMDEAGRGPIAGPLVTAGVVFPPGYENPALYDSKKLSEKKREALYPQILEDALEVQIRFVSEPEIDRLNIYRATQQAMEAMAERMTCDVILPLRYNNDKRKKPLFSRGLSVCRHLFNSFSKLKHGEKNIEKRRLFH